MHKVVNGSISVTGNRHIVTVDGVEVLSLIDSTYTAGYVSVSSWNNSRVELDQLTVKKN